MKERLSEIRGSCEEKEKIQPPFSARMSTMMLIIPTKISVAMRMMTVDREELMC